MSRRVNMPGADELFRSTARAENDPEPESTSAEAASPAPAQRPVASGRVKHDQKMTVYLTSDELLAVESARLQLRAGLGRNVDRGRLVRAALELALADLEARGSESLLAQRLGENS